MDRPSTFAKVTLPLQPLPCFRALGYESGGSDQGPAVV